MDMLMHQIVNPYFFDLQILILNLAEITNVSKTASIKVLSF